MIKQVVFDLGNVLATFRPADFIQHYTKEPLVAKFLLENIFQSPEWIAYDRGTISKAAIEEQLITKRPDLKETIQAVLKNWHHEITPIAEMAELVQKLQANGYPTYILSNAPTEVYEILETFPAAEKMTGIFISADWKMIKPEKEIYRSFCHHFHLVPSQCLFIDDLPANVEGARQAGFESIVFRQDVQQLMAELAQHNISL